MAGMDDTPPDGHGEADIERAPHLKQWYLWGCVVIVTLLLATLNPAHAGTSNTSRVGPSMPGGATCRGPQKFTVAIMF